MTLPTGVLAVAENNYGRPDQALDYLKRMSRSFSYALPGSMYEVSPDYGMMAQAWNIYAFAVPVVRQFFGISPMASKKEIWIQPQMPSSWDDASLEQVLIGDNQVSVYYRKDAGGMIILKVLQEREDWLLHIGLGHVPESDIRILTGDGDLTQGENGLTFSASGNEIQIQYSPE